MKANYLLFFALIEISITYCAAQNSSQFNHFWLVQLWPRGYCLERRCFRQSEIFVLHGLWPVSSSGQTLVGDNKSDPNAIATLTRNKKLKNEFLTYWLSLGTKDRWKLPEFWSYQWKKHGSAQKVIAELDYYIRSLELTKRTDLLSTLARKGIVPNGAGYPRDKYRKAIEAKTGYTPILDCVEDNGRYYLKEVTICVDPEAKNFISCNNLIYRGSCRVENIRFSPPAV